MYQNKYVCGTLGIMEIRADMNFAELVRQTRTDLGLSQADCAQRAGLDATAWSRAERGAYHRMTLEMGLRMLHGLGMVLNATHVPEAQQLPMFREARVEES